MFRGLSMLIAFGGIEIGGGSDSANVEVRRKKKTASTKRRISILSFKKKDLDRDIADNPRTVSTFVLSIAPVTFPDASV